MLKKIGLKHAGFVIGACLLLGGWLMRLFVVSGLADVMTVSEPLQIVMNDIGRRAAGCSAYFLLGGILLYGIISARENRAPSVPQAAAGDVIDEITLRPFSYNPVTLRAFSNGTSYVLLDIFPPDRDGDRPQETARFEEDFLAAVGVIIAREDRDRFIVHSSDTTVLNRAATFLLGKMNEWDTQNNLEILQRYFSMPPVQADALLTNDEMLLIWIDWRENDSDVIEYVASRIQGGELSADDDGRGGMVIHYQGQTRAVVYPDGVANRNDTLITLSTLLAPDYQIRLWEGSVGSDTLGFVVLPSAAWQTLEQTFGAAMVAQHFSALYPGRMMF